MSDDRTTSATPIRRENTALPGGLRVPSEETVRSAWSTYDARKEMSRSTTLVTEATRLARATREFQVETNGLHRDQVLHDEELVAAVVIIRAQTDVAVAECEQKAAALRGQAEIEKYERDLKKAELSGDATLAALEREAKAEMLRMRLAKMRAMNQTDMASPETSS